MRVGICQFNPEHKDTELNLQYILSILERYSGEVGFDLMVFPELATSGYIFNSKAELAKCALDIQTDTPFRRITHLLAKNNAYTLIGYPERVGNKIFNSAVLLSGRGVEQNYRKVHLFNTETQVFTPGDLGYQVTEVKGVKIGIMICYDWIYPEAARSLALKGAQIICHPSNLVMPYCQQAMYCRAVENRVFTITANRVGHEQSDSHYFSFTGQSVMVSPTGDYLIRMSSDQSEVTIIDLDITRCNPKINDYNSLFKDRRISSYHLK